MASWHRIDRMTHQSHARCQPQSGSVGGRQPAGPMDKPATTMTPFMPLGLHTTTPPPRHLLKGARGSPTGVGGGAKEDMFSSCPLSSRGEATGSIAKRPPCMGGGSQEYMSIFRYILLQGPAIDHCRARKERPVFHNPSSECHCGSHHRSFPLPPSSYAWERTLVDSLQLQGPAVGIAGKKKGPTLSRQASPSDVGKGGRGVHATHAAPAGGGASRCDL